MDLMEAIDPMGAIDPMEEIDSIEGIEGGVLLRSSFPSPTK